MIGITTTLLILIALFALFVVVRLVFSVDVCALCASVSLGWIGLLVLMWRGISVDPILVGILMGGSTVGLMYYLADRFGDSYKLFKLPFVLTLIALVYIILGGPVNIVHVLLVLGGLWLLFASLFLLRGHAGVRTYLQHIIDCCKNW